MTMLSQDGDNFPPEQVKEMIGQLSVSVARSTEPANKISLTSSRISTLHGVLKYKCRKWMMPSISTLLYKTIDLMIVDMLKEEPVGKVHAILNELEVFLNAECDRTMKEKKQYYPAQSLELLQDYNTILECRERWKIANDTYMHNNNAWAVSNKMIADINDQLSDIELKYNLIVMPKNASFDINDLSLFNRKQQEGQE